ncbi:MAG TPA: alpha/beta hydrolase-fold protein [Puia sp.]|jgi:enterochelin esterase-like enzyme
MNSVFLPIFENMLSVNPEIKSIETLSFPSEILARNLRIDFYLPPVTGDQKYPMDVLLINDGQDLQTMGLDSILGKLYRAEAIRPVLCVGIHAGPLRKFEYGTAITADYKGRGNLASRYMHFIVQELMPAIHLLFPDKLETRWAFAGFSLGGLSALDISWKHGHLFNLTGIFSGSLWWRTLDKDDPEYQDEQHRIMHNQIRDGESVPGMKFFFECGTADEAEDRNENGVIDSIDDTLDLIEALKNKGYDSETDICYYEIDGGKHDIPTWAHAMPVFLRWGFGKMKSLTL